MAVRRLPENTSNCSVLQKTEKKLSLEKKMFKQWNQDFDSRNETPERRHVISQ